MGVFIQAESNGRGGKVGEQSSLMLEEYNILKTRVKISTRPVYKNQSKTKKISSGQLRQRHR